MNLFKLILCSILFFDLCAFCCCRILFIAIMSYENFTTLLGTVSDDNSVLICSKPYIDSTLVLV